jgi:hypothetical protein
MRRMARSLACVASLLLAAACEGLNYGITMDAPPPPLRLSVPEEAFSLSASERARVRPGFDADALERLLRMVRPDMRSEILMHFQFVPEGTGRRYGQLVEFHDPQLQVVLEQVWAPMWDEVGATDEQIAQNAFQYPGRELARQRRAAARARQNPSGS